MSLLLAAALSAAPATLPICSWDRPGHNPFMGSVVAAVDHYADIPAPVRERLKARMTRHQYDEIASIRRDRIEGRGRYTDLRQMHFGQGQVCIEVTRDKWSDGAEERGLVYCEDDHCLIVPTVCRNLSRVTRLPVPPARNNSPAPAAPRDAESASPSRGGAGRTEWPATAEGADPADAERFAGVAGLQGYGGYGAGGSPAASAPAFASAGVAAWQGWAQPLAILESRNQRWQAAGGGDSSRQALRVPPADEVQQVQAEPRAFVPPRYEPTLTPPADPRPSSAAAQRLSPRSRAFEPDPEASAATPTPVSEPGSAALALLALSIAAALRSRRPKR